MLELLNVCQEYLELEYPIDIRIKTRSKKSCDAKYNAMLSSDNQLVHHRITIYLGNLGYNSRTFDELLAHELIHAWQQENHYLDVHGKSFQFCAEGLQECLQSFGFDVHNLYMPDLDK